MNSEQTLADWAGGLLLTVGTSIPVLLYFLVFGLAVRMLLRRHSLPDSFFVTVGLGLAVSVVGVTLGFTLLNRLAVVVWGLLGVAALVVVVGVVLQRRLPFDAFAVRADLVGLAGALLVLTPVLGYGQRFWTIGANDFPSYAGSVYTWASVAGEGPDFLARHPDVWGEMVYERGLFEKPMGTALMVVTHLVGRVAPESQLNLLMFVCTLVGITGFIVLVQRLFQLSTLWASVAVLPSAFSAVPLFRLYEAQVGQVQVIALVSVLLIVVSTLADPDGVGGFALPAVVTALVTAATVGSNFTLALGSAPVIGVLALLVLTRSLSVVRALIRLLIVAVLAVVVSVPLFSWYYASLTLQGAGDSGYAIPLPSAWALLGLERAGAPDGGLAALLTWVFVTAICYGIWHQLTRPTLQRSRLVVACAALVGVNGLLLGLMYGLDSYNTNKWLALVVPLCSPFILGALLTVQWEPFHRLARAVAVFCTTAALIISLPFGFSIGNVVATDTYDLAESDRLAEIDTLNIDFTPSTELLGIFASSIAAMRVQSPEVVMVGSWLDLASPPRGHWYLVDREREPRAGEIRSSEPINDRYELQERYVPLSWGRTEINTDTPLLSGYLQGWWYAPESHGVWSGGRRAYLSFDVPDDASGPLYLTLTGSRYVDRPKELRITSWGRELARHEFVTEGAQDITVRLEPDDVRDGQVTLALWTPHATVEEFAAPGEQRRRMGYFLSAVTLQPATAG